MSSSMMTNNIYTWTSKKTYTWHDSISSLTNRIISYARKESAKLEGMNLVYKEELYIESPVS